jgi:hypothetical protein
MKFFITFGQKYRHEEHPQGGHPDGWFEVNAPDIATVREKAFNAFKNHWAFIYTETEFDPSYHPLGKLGEID